MSINQSNKKNRYAVGMGCSRGCSVDVLRQLLHDNFQKHNLDTNDIVAICSIDVKHDEVGLIALAKELDVRFIVYSAEQLRTVEDRLSVKSQRVFDEVGCYGVAEGACLFYSIQSNRIGTRLIVKKDKCAEATVAVSLS